MPTESELEKVFASTEMSRSERAKSTTDKE